MIITFIIYFQYIPIIIAYFPFSLLFLFHVDNVTANIIYVSSVVAVVALVISQTIATIDSDRDYNGDSDSDTK